METTIKNSMYILENRGRNGRLFGKVSVYSGRVGFEVEFKGSDPIDATSFFEFLTTVQYVEKSYDICNMTILVSDRCWLMDGGAWFSKWCGVVSEFINSEYLDAMKRRSKQ